MDDAIYDTYDVPVISSFVSDAAPTNVIDAPEHVSLNAGARYASVRDFDIAGIMVGMSFEDIELMFFKTRGLYVPVAKNAIKYTIPDVWKNNLDYECRGANVNAPAALEKCINSFAQSRGLMYASTLSLARAETGETIDVYFTSNATDNVVYRVVYNNDVNEISGANPKFADQRDKKILAFWAEVLEKYGAPNSGNDKWVSSDNNTTPILTAFYGRLDLVDNGMNARDAAENIRAARENFKAKSYAF